MTDCMAEMGGKMMNRTIRKTRRILAVTLITGAVFASGAGASGAVTPAEGRTPGQVVAQKHAPSSDWPWSMVQAPSSDWPW